MKKLIKIIGILLLSVTTMHLLISMKMSTYDRQARARAYSLLEEGVFKGDAGKINEAFAQGANSYHCDTIARYPLAKIASLNAYYTLQGDQIRTKRDILYQLAGHNTIQKARL